MKCDLHCHTRRSDGSLLEDELVQIAKLSKLDGLAITDHDVYTNIALAKELEKKYDIKILHGTEISGFDYNKNRLVHVLCYMSKEPEKLSPMFKDITKRREEEVSRVLEMVVKLYPITEKMVRERAKHSETLFKQHIMETLVDVGYSDKIYSELHTYLFNSKTGIAKTSIVYPDVFDVLEEIKNSKGIPVLAHPTIYDSVELIPELSKRGLKGIELYYPRIDSSRYDDMLNFSKEFDLIRTGGTDFHGGMTNKVMPIGTCTTPEEEYKRLISLIE